MGSLAVPSSISLCFSLVSFFKDKQRAAEAHGKALLKTREDSSDMSARQTDRGLAALSEWFRGNQVSIKDR